MMTKQIIVKLEGGLGNQLFQYFAALQLSNELGVRLCLDITYYFQNYTKNHEKPYLLDYKYVRDNHVIWKRLPRITREFWKLAPFLARTRKVCLITDTNLQVKDKAYLILMRGVFQDLKLLPSPSKISEVMRLGVANDAQKHIDKFLNEKTCIFHIRRGDFLQYPSHNILNRNYYLKALSLVRKLEGNKNYVLMSDDVAGAISWLNHENLRIDIFDSENVLRPPEVMEIASLCQSVILANSTFSWWVAYLGSTRGSVGLVLYPEDLGINNLQFLTSIFSRSEWIPLNRDGVVQE